jgi:hypothetical protein
MSDLHLEMFPGFRIALENVTSPFLLLAGDVGDPGSDEYASFLRDCASKFEEVFVVMGNHEGYGRSWDEARALARQTCESTGPNIHLLDRSSQDIVLGNDIVRRVRVIGATLWSHVESHDACEVNCFIADYRRIKGMRSVSDSNAMHAEDVAWLRTELALAETEDGSVDVVVVTHHAPSLHGTSRPEHRSSPLNSAFATALDDLVDHPCVSAWVHGHTHHSHETMRGGAPLKLRLLAANQRGYQGERRSANFDVRRSFRVQS